MGDITVNASDVLRNLAAVKSRLVGAVAGGMFEGAQRVEDLAHERVPKDTGLLDSTIHTQEPIITENMVEVRVSAGEGGAEDYALPVHEDLTKFHPRGAAKYLEGPQNEKAEEFFSAVVTAVEEVA